MIRRMRFECWVTQKTFFHDSCGYANAPERYVVRALLACFQLVLGLCQGMCGRAMSVSVCPPVMAMLLYVLIANVKFTLLGKGVTLPLPLRV